MKEKYSNVCKKIIEYYSQILEEKEIIAIKKIIQLNNYDNINIIIFINNILDKIWNKTLTLPNEYKEGQCFTFLITRDLLPNEQNFNSMNEFQNKQKYFLELITDETIIETVNGINGFIVKIDYQNSFSEPLLPIDFQNQRSILIKSNLNFLGIYNISLGLKKYDDEEELSTNFAKLVKLPKLDINKALYNYQKNNIILDKTDKESLADIIILYYLIENHIDKKIDIIQLRDELKYQYKNKIAKEYESYFYKTISLDEFINNAFNYLKKSTSVHIVDKKM